MHGEKYVKSICMERSMLNQYCTVPENVHTPPQNGLEFLGVRGGGSVRPKH